MTTERRKNIYLTPAMRELLTLIAAEYHDGNESAAIARALADHHARGDMIRRAIIDLGKAIEPDEQFDPAEDTRAERPHLALAALLDEMTARAIGDALTELWERWALNSGNPPQIA